MKSEPDTFSIDDLGRAPGKTECWDGVRNYQARNFMRDNMKVGDRVLFYHSNAKPPGVVGTAEVVREAYPDTSAFDENSPYFDPKSNPNSPRWFMVDIRLEEKFSRMVPLERLKKEPSLSKMKVLQKGNRLSITPVTEKEFNHIVQMGV